MQRASGLIAAGACWRLRARPACGGCRSGRCSRCATVTVESMYGMDAAACERADRARQRAAADQGQFLHRPTWNRCARRSSRCPGCGAQRCGANGPNQLIVDVEEHEPLGTWGEDGRLLSVKGDVFTANLAEADEDGDAARIRAARKAARRKCWRAFRELRAWFAPVKLTPEAVQPVEPLCVDRQAGQRHERGAGTRADRTTLKSRVQRLVSIYPQLVARLQDRIENDRHALSERPGAVGRWPEGAGG